MNVREIKAYVHRNRIADVVNALYNAGFKNLTVIDVEGLRTRIVELQSMVDTLQDLANHCDGDSRPDCPILADFQGSEL